MDTLNIAALVNLLGWAIGFALYLLLFTLSYRAVRSRTNRRKLTRERDESGIGAWTPGGHNYLPLLTAVFGLLWNAGALVAHGFTFFDAKSSAAGTLPLFAALAGATAVSALGFLPSVVVHTTLLNLRFAGEKRHTSKIIGAAYALSSTAAAMHLYRAFTMRDESSDAALQMLTFGFVLVMISLFFTTRCEPGRRQAAWAVALSVFAVSALHLSGGTHIGHERWYLELIGHHASLPLALAILYQDYRFAFADIFLKRALALIMLAGMIVGAFTFVSTILALLFTSDAGVFVNTKNAHAGAVGVLLVVWAATIVLYPRLVRLSDKFVEKIVLRRIDYDEFRLMLARLTQTHEDLTSLLDEVCARLAPALGASYLRWNEVGLEDATRNAAEGASANRAFRLKVDDGLLTIIEQRTVSAPLRPERQDVGGEVEHTTATLFIPTTEPPHYEVRIGALAGARRLLSDDIEMLESLAVTVARRIDALRIVHERCEQVQREQQIAKLATEAQLRALRAQINPHFLFNALTTIGYLIQTSPPRALETLMRLSDLLRGVLRATAEWVTLGEELKLIEAYLDIERARFEERLRVHFDIGKELHELLVPSLVVQPIIENAIKHGIAPQKAGGEIYIAARMESEILIISVRDTGAGVGSVELVEGKRNGVGLANVEQRLRLCCGGAGKLSFDSAPDSGATVELRLPVRHHRVEMRSQSEKFELNATPSVTVRGAISDTTKADMQTNTEAVAIRRLA